MQLYPREKTSNISAARVKALLTLGTVGGKKKKKSLPICNLPKC